MNYRITLAVAAATALLASQVMAADSPGASFLEEAIKGNIFEVQVGQLAARKATDAEVRKFGATLNTDHGVATQKASLAAQALGVTPATSLDAKHQAKYDKLSKLPAARFDRAFIDEMLEDHQQDIAQYEKAAQGSDAAAQYAKETLPRLREHLQMVQRLKDSTGGSAAAKERR
jgi:putative membrane protein